MAEPDTSDWVPGLVTVTVLVTVHENGGAGVAGRVGGLHGDASRSRRWSGCPMIVPVEELMMSPAAGRWPTRCRSRRDWVSVAELVRW